MRSNSALTIAIGTLVCLTLSSGCSPEGDGGGALEHPAARSNAPVDPAPAVAPKALGTDPPQLILMVSLDTLRADHLGLYGYARPTSPVLDQLAREGVVFEDASSTAPWTLPAHASMLTGLYPLNHRATSTRTRLPKRISTLPALLAKQGYDTAAVVNTPWLQKNTFGVTKDFAKYLLVQPTVDRSSPSTWVTDQAINWLKEIGDDRLFLFVHYLDIHTDYTSLPAFEKLFVTPYDGPADGTAWQLTRAGFSDAYLAFCRDFDPTQWTGKLAPCSFRGDFADNIVDRTTERMDFDERDIQHLSELYDAGIRQLDTELGRLFGYLDESGLSDRTLLVVVSDHGEGFGEHGEVEHFLTTYQEVIRVPMIFRGPGLPANTRISTPVSLVDLAPTILHAAKAEIPDAIDGVDLSPLWRDAEGGDVAERYLYTEAAGGVHWSLIAPGLYPEYRAIRSGAHKMVYSSEGDRYELFDLVADPGEQHDISAQKPELFAKLKDEMIRRYLDFSPQPTDETKLELDQTDVDRLRALGYIE